MEVKHLQQTSVIIPAGVIKEHVIILFLLATLLRSTDVELVM